MIPRPLAFGVVGRLLAVLVFEMGLEDIRQEWVWGCRIMLGAMEEGHMV